MPVAVATESSHLTLFFFLSLSLPILIISFRQSALICVCPPPFLASLRRFIFFFGLFPHFLPLDSPCEPTERRFNPSLIVKINGFSRSFLYAASPLRSQKRAEAMRRCNVSGSLLFPYSRKLASMFLTLAG